MLTLSCLELDAPHFDFESFIEYGLFFQNFKKDVSIFIGLVFFFFSAKKLAVILIDPFITYFFMWLSRFACYLWFCKDGCLCLLCFGFVELLLSMG